MPSWRAARCITTLRNEINAAWPKRDKSSDGVIGDQAHASRKSDHNPDGNGVVHAVDIDKDGIPADDIVEFLRSLAVAGDPRFKGGYLIWQGRICSERDGWKWRTYTGSNPHDKHFHWSCTYDQACDAQTPFNIERVKAPAPKPQPKPTPPPEDHMAYRYIYDGKDYATDLLRRRRVTSLGVLKWMDTAKNKKGDLLYEPLGTLVKDQHDVFAPIDPAKDA